MIHKDKNGKWYVLIDDAEVLGGLLFLACVVGAVLLS